MITATHSTVTEDGSELYIFECDGESIDEVRMILSPSEDTFSVAAMKDDERVYQNSFGMRELSFDPVSVLGRGVSERLGGVSASTNPYNTTGEVGYEGVPDPVRVALNSMGFAVVPEGRGWLDV
jgi:uncharacterized protein YkuJ